MAQSFVSARTPEKKKLSDLLLLLVKIETIKKM